MILRSIIDDASQCIQKMFLSNAIYKYAQQKYKHTNLKCWTKMFSTSQKCFMWICLWNVLFCSNPVVHCQLAVATIDYNLRLSILTDISLMATWMCNVAEVKSRDQLLCPLLNDIIWPSNKILPPSIICRDFFDQEGLLVLNCPPYSPVTYRTLLGSFG